MFLALMASNMSVMHCLVLFPSVYTYKFGFSCLTFHFALAKPIFYAVFPSTLRNVMGQDSWDPLALEWV